MNRAPHDRMVTPQTDPDRFTEDEAAAFWRGVCGQTGYGYWGNEICGQASKPGASFGNCELHDAEMLVEHWPDGTPRPDCGFDADRPRREAEALAAHQRQCRDEECECRG
jgi:hypothetical protein